MGFFAQLMQLGFFYSFYFLSGRMTYHPPFFPTKISKRCVVFYLQNSATEGRWKNKALIIFFLLKKIHSQSIVYLKHIENIVNNLINLFMTSNNLKNNWKTRNQSEHENISTVRSTFSCKENDKKKTSRWNSPH